MINRILLISLALQLAGCGGYKTGKGGVQYKIVIDVNTPPVAKLAVVFLSYTEATENGKVLAATGTFDPRPAEVYATMPKFHGDLQDVFPFLSEGDSAIVRVSMDSLKRGGYIMPLADDTSKFMIYTLKLNKVINQGIQDTGFLERVAAYKRAELLRFKAAEAARIQAYLRVKKLYYRKSTDGLLYPKGLKLADNSGKKLYVQYKLTSLDGKLYGAGLKELTLPASPSHKNPAILRALQNLVPFPGFLKAVSLLPAGISTTVIIPSHLAYGVRGNNTDMPPYTPLIGEFRLLNQ